MVSTCAFSRLNTRSASSAGFRTGCVVLAPLGEVWGGDHSAEAAEFAWSVPRICPEVPALIKTSHTNMLDIKASSAMHFDLFEMQSASEPAPDLRWLKCTAFVDLLPVGVFTKSLKDLMFRQCNRAHHSFSFQRIVDLSSRFGATEFRNGNPATGIRELRRSRGPCATPRLSVKCPGFQSHGIFFSVCIFNGVILHGAALRRHCHRRRPQRACERGLPCQGREEGARARTQTRPWWGCRH